MKMAEIITEAESNAKQALAKSPIFEIRSLQVESDGDSLLLTGRVESFYHKQVAQEVIRAAACGVPVVNTVDVE